MKNDDIHNNNVNTIIVILEITFITFASLNI